MKLRLFALPLVAACAFSTLPGSAQSFRSDQPSPGSGSFRSERPKPVPSQTLLGSWIGEYNCAQGVTRLHLNVGEAMPNFVRAVFHFYESPRNPGVPTGCFMVGGRYSQSSRQVDLKAERWLLRPPNYAMVGVQGRFSPDGQNFTGTITGAPGCTRVTLMKWSDPPQAPPECQHEEP